MREEIKINELDSSLWLFRAITMYITFMERHAPAFIDELDYRMAIYHLGGEVDRINIGVEEERANNQMKEGNE